MVLYRLLWSIVEGVEDLSHLAPSPEVHPETGHGAAHGQADDTGAGTQTHVWTVGSRLFGTLDASVSRRAYTLSRKSSKTIFFCLSPSNNKSSGKIGINDGPATVPYSQIWLYFKLGRPFYPVYHRLFQ